VIDFSTSISSLGKMIGVRSTEGYALSFQSTTSDHTPSDSDFTRLAQRIREKGRYVIGYGEEKTPPSFRASCNDFVVLSVDKAKTKARTDSVSEVERLLLQGIDLNSDDDGWCDVAALAGYLKKIKPDFAPVDLGVKKFSDFFKDKANEYELRKQNPNGPGPMFVRRKDKRKP
jgi:hypothetical protein